MELRLYQNTGTSESTSKPAIDQLNAVRARALPSRPAIAVPNAAHTITEARHATVSTPATTRVCLSTSPPTVVKAASAPITVTQPFGLTQVKRAASTKVIGFARRESPPFGSALAMRQAR
jgi:hypothetical protein